MRHLLLCTWVCILLSLNTYAQVPQGIPYQAVARNAAGEPLANQSVKVRFSILDSLITGPAVYVETHTTTTSSLGLFVTNVGMGTPTSGTFSNINWGQNFKFLKVEFDTTTSGNNYINLGTQQMMSVPYAFFAGSSATVGGNGVQGQVLTYCNGVPTWTTGGQCPGLIASLNCGSATNSGALTQGAAANGVSTIVPYTGGNGGAYSGQTITSTGVTGLTATLSSGNFANGAGNLNYLITGTPTSSGTANFALNIGDQSCTLNRVVSLAIGTYPQGSVFCASGPTLVVDVVNPATGKTWMDRNLGATQVATSSTDANAYGDLYQWGRRSDGHQCRNSPTATTLSSTNQPVHGNFTVAPNSPYDWRSPQNANLWQGINGANNPCPSGYRIPTQAELNSERLSWNSATISGAFASTLKLPATGVRNGINGSINLGAGFYWSCSVSNTFSVHLEFYGSYSNMSNTYRADGMTVRCLKD